MRDVAYPQLVLVVLVVCLFGGLVWGLSTSGTAFDPYNTDWDGGSELRGMMDTDDTEVTATLSTSTYDANPPEQTVAVVLEPGERYGPADRARLSSFVARGGTLVVAATSNESNALLADIGSTVRLDGTPVRDEQSNHHDPALVRATDVSTDPLVRDVDALTLNHGTVLDAQDGTPLVNTSVVSYLDTTRTQQLEENETLASYPVAAVETLDQGRVVVVSDSSVFTNAMVELDGNAQFVTNLADDHEYVILDYSQREALPPLSYAILFLRETPLLQLAVGMAGVGAIALWGRSTDRLARRVGVGRFARRVGAGRFARRVGVGGVARRLRAGGPGESHQESVQPPLQEDALASYLRDRHPDWDDERVRRVTKAIIRQRRQEGDDD